MLKFLVDDNAFLQELAMEDFFCKFKRRTIPYGKQIGDLDAPKRYREYLDEVYLREMNFAAGGVGCATWDAAVILGHWIRDNCNVFYEKSVHELGAGVGLPGLMAARFAKSVLISDYVPILVKNLKYEIGQNSRPYQEYTQEMTPEELEQDKKVDVGQVIPPEVEANETDDERRQRFAYNVGRSADSALLDWLEFRNMPAEEIEGMKADIILGSEVSYIQNKETLDSLLDVINTLVNDGGVFYLVQSTDRGTSHIFTQVMQEKYNFTLDIHDVPEHILDFYATGQLREKYQYYTFRRPNSTFKVMKAADVKATDSQSSEEDKCVETDNEVTVLATDA